LGQEQVSYDVDNGTGDAKGLFPPIACTGVTGAPIVNVDVINNSSVKVTVTFAGTTSPVVVNLAIGPYP
jgi:hypothetical protein